jgi:serine/threonine protein kinase
MLDYGTVVHDRYRILRPVGKGGMGAVYEAIDLRLHNTVAIKRMTAEGPDADRAFAQEAQLLATLRHSALPGVIDFFVEQDSRFLVMHYIDGEDLERVRKRAGGRCEESELLAWGVEVLNVLAFLHRYDPPIVHRDIKPANLKLTPRGEIVLLDFGLAKRVHLAATQIDPLNVSIYGFTANYAPPEQQLGRGTDGRSDVYALGATLYHLATGVPPAAAAVRIAAVSAELPDPLVAACAVQPSVSEAFSRVLARAMQLSADLRFQTAEEMREALAELRNLAREKPRGEELRTARRIDAAMPRQAQVGSQVDLIIQVRFSSSPRLGLEDWPSKHVPDAIEQASEEFDLEHPTDPRTHRRLPVRLRLKLVAPDFAIDGTAERLIEVPPDTYSKRLAFLMTPRRVGPCRVHVEVYALDFLHVGTVPIEVDAVGAVVSSSDQRVAQLLLLMLASGAAHAPNPFKRNPDEGANTEATLSLQNVREAQADKSLAAATVFRASPRPRSWAKWTAIGAPLAVLVTTVLLMQSERTALDSPRLPTAQATPPVLPAPSTSPSAGEGPRPSASPPSPRDLAAERAARQLRDELANERQLRDGMARGTAPAAPGSAQGLPAPPPPAPPPPVASDEEQAKKDISALLEAYRRAYEARDITAIKQVFPTAPDALKSQFAQVTSLAVTATGPPQFREVDSTSALVEIGWRRTGILANGRKDDRNQLLRIQLTRKTFDNRWVITAARFSEAP